MIEEESKQQKEEVEEKSKSSFQSSSEGSSSVDVSAGDPESYGTPIIQRIGSQADQQAIDEDLPVIMVRTLQYNATKHTK